MSSITSFLALPFCCAHKNLKKIVIIYSIFNTCIILSKRSLFSCQQCPISITPENVRKPLLWRYRNGTLAWKGLMLCSLIHFKKENMKNLKAEHLCKSLLSNQPPLLAINFMRHIFQLTFSKKSNNQYFHDFS